MRVIKYERDGDLFTSFKLVRQFYPNQFFYANIHVRNYLRKNNQFLIAVSEMHWKINDIPVHIEAL